MSRATERMRELIEEATAGDPDDRDLWIERGQAALSQEFGSDSHELKRFRAIAYGSLAKNTSTVRSGAYDHARSEGIQKASRILMAVCEAREDTAEGSEVSTAVKSDLPAGRVFFVHGRDSANNEAMTQFLESLVLRVIPWEEAVRETGNPNPHVGHIVDKGIEMADAVLVMFSADERVRLRPELALPSDPPEEGTERWQSRANVIYEAGLAMARSHKSTVLVSVGDVPMFSDLSGLHILRFDASSKSRNDLVERLEIAGLEPIDTGSRYLKAGDFDVRSPHSGLSVEQEHSEESGSNELVDETTEPPGTVESLAAMEDATPVVTDALSSIGRGAKDLTALMDTATKRAEHTQTAKQRLPILHKFAQDLAPLVGEEETRALVFHEYIGMMDDGVNVLLDHAESDELEEDDRAAFVSMLDALVSAGEQTRSLSASIGRALLQVQEVGSLARSVKAQTKRLEGAYRMHQSSLETIDAWASRAEQILNQL